MISNSRIVVARDGLASLDKLPEVLATRVDGEILRWFVASATPKEFIVEATVYQGTVRQFRAPAQGFAGGKTSIVNLIPTGVGCEIGGFAGDAAPVTELLAACTDYLVTNPNAVNASNFVHLTDRAVYTEGSCIDDFMMGRIHLRVPFANKVGLIIERAQDTCLDIVFNIVNTVRAVHGVDIVDCVVTDKPIGARCVKNDSGAYVGTVDDPKVLLDACAELRRRGANAIAITTRVKDLPVEDYAAHFRGEHPNPVGGVEAIISHLICRTFGVPAAHAPMINFTSSLSKYDVQLEDDVVDPRGAGERASVSGLACVLIGLKRAPQFGDEGGYGPSRQVLTRDGVLAVVTPSGCLGGIPVLQAHRAGIPVIAVEENRTLLDVTAEKLGLEGVIRASTYAEAAGMVLALREGISLASIRRPLRALKPLSPRRG